MNELKAQDGSDEKRNLPIGKNEDVHFSSHLADEDDLEAESRAEAADNRQEQE